MGEGRERLGTEKEGREGGGEGRKEREEGKEGRRERRREGSCTVQNIPDIRVSFHCKENRDIIVWHHC